MGCGGGKDAQATVYDQIQTRTVQTNIIEFDQIFLVLAEILKEAEDIRQNVIPGRVNMIQISKASHISNPTVLDAYKLWTWGVSCCNKGETSGLLNTVNIISGVKYDFDTENHTFKYKLGKCGDVTFDWFGDFLNDYVSGVSRAKVTFPEVKARVQNMFDRIKGMKMKIFGYLAPFQGNDKWKAIGMVGLNMASLGRGVQVADEFQKHLEEYVQEVQSLYDKHEEIEKEADEVGKRIYEEYGIVPVEKSEPSEDDKFKMKIKMNLVVQHYYKGATSRTLEEQKQYDAIKAERLKNRPKRTKDYKPDDRGIEEGKIFPFRTRWTLCQPLDLAIGEMSMILEDMNIQMTKHKKFRNLIRYHTETYTLKDDTLTEAWKIMCWALVGEHGTMKDKKQDKLEIKDANQPAVGLDKLKLKDAVAEEVRGYFLELWAIVPPTRLDVLKAGWQKFNDNFGTLIKSWSEGEFTNFPEFKQSKIQYYDKFGKEHLCAQGIQTKSQSHYAKRLAEGEELYKNGQAIVEDASAKAATYKGVAFKELIKKHEGAKGDADKVSKRKAKLAAFYEANKKKK